MYNKKATKKKANQNAKKAKKSKKSKKKQKKQQKTTKNEKQKNIELDLYLKLVKFYYNYYSYNCNLFRISRQS